MRFFGREVGGIHLVQVGCAMDLAVEKSDVLLRLAASRLRGLEHRLFFAEVTEALCDGNPRWAER